MDTPAPGRPSSQNRNRNDWRWLANAEQTRGCQQMPRARRHLFCQRRQRQLPAREACGHGVRPRMAGRQLRTEKAMGRLGPGASPWHAMAHRVAGSRAGCAPPHPGEGGATQGRQLHMPGACGARAQTAPQARACRKANPKRAAYRAPRSGRKRRSEARRDQQPWRPRRNTMERTARFSPPMGSGICLWRPLCSPEVWADEGFKLRLPLAVIGRHCRPAGSHRVSSASEPRAAAPLCCTLGLSDRLSLNAQSSCARCSRNAQHAHVSSVRAPEGATTAQGESLVGRHNVSAQDEHATRSRLSIRSQTQVLSSRRHDHLAQPVTSAFDRFALNEQCSATIVKKHDLHQSGEQQLQTTHCTRRTQ